MAFASRLYQSLVQPPKSLWQWLVSVAHLQGAFFLGLMTAVYWMQGIRGYTSQAAMYLFKGKLRAPPSLTQVVKTVGKQPWNFKFVYGIVSDNFPIRKKHVKYYMIFSGIIGFVGSIGLGLPIYSNYGSMLVGTMFLCLINLGGAFADVLVDALVVKKGRLDEDGSARLQSWCWAMLAIGGVMGTAFGGAMVEHLDPSTYFYIMAIFPIIMICLGIGLEEEESDFKFNYAMLRRQVKAVFITLKTPSVIRPLGWIFASNAIVPSLGDGMTYFRNAIGLGPAELGYVDTVAYVALLVGTMIYARFLIGVSFRKIFFWTQVAAVLLSALDLVQVFRLNVAIGMPDILFVLTSDAITEVLGRFSSMPFLVISAQLCPEWIEATLFATLMSLSNASVDISVLFGSFFLEIYGITDENFDNLWKCIMWRTALATIPLLFIWLLPDTGKVDQIQIEAPEVRKDLEMEQVEWIEEKRRRFHSQEIPMVDPTTLETTLRRSQSEEFTRQDSNSPLCDK